MKGLFDYPSQVDLTQRLVSPFHLHDSFAMQRFTSLIDSPAMQQIRQQTDAIQRVTSLIESPAMQQIRQQTDAMQRATALIDSYGIQRAASLIDSSAMQKIQRQTDAMQRATSLIDSSAMQKIRQQTDLLLCLTTSDLQFADIAFDEGIVTVSGSPIDIIEFEEVVSNTAENSSDANEFLEKIIAWIEDPARKSDAQNVLRYLFLSFFFAVVVPTHLNPWSAEERHKLVKEISQEIKETHSSDDIKSYRYVTAKSGLRIRLDSNIKSQQIGGLPFASVVTLINKSENNDWSFIEDDDGNQGWVFSRHLKKFK